jgi:RimJ/RimL family protein N-acetyltransferase
MRMSVSATTSQAGAMAELRGEGVWLRAPREDDINALMRLPIDPDVVRGYGVVQSEPRERSRENATKAIRSLQAHRLAWIIDYSGYVGHVRLHTVVASDRRASLAVGIDDGARLGRGIGSAAVRLVLGHAFGSLGLNRVSVRVLADNPRAIRCYERVGFVHEGREREAACVGAAFVDDVIMGILASEFGKRVT